MDEGRWRAFVARLFTSVVLVRSTIQSPTPMLSLFAFPKDVGCAFVLPAIIALISHIALETVDKVKCGSDHTDLCGLSGVT